MTAAKALVKHYRSYLAIVGLGLASLMVNAGEAEQSNFDSSPQYRDGQFHNSKLIPPTKYWPIAARYLRGEGEANTPSIEIPVIELSRTDIERLPAAELSVIRFGHSTSLVKIANQLWLIDPMFSSRASPLRIAGPKRFHAPPIAIQDLPDLDGVIISHNHYDHLDKQSIQALKGKVKHFITPLGVGAKLRAWGIDEKKVSELDWWDSVEISTLTITATPAQHFSGRGLFDRNETLWASWVLKSAGHRFFYSGDSGYFDGFAEIGDRFGPFDLAQLEVGAYDSMWPYVHMSPEEAVSAYRDLKAHKLMPVHNGTFDLAFHPWYEPFDRMVELAMEQNVNLLTPRFGEIISVDNVGQSFNDTLGWWKK